MHFPDTFRAPFEYPNRTSTTEVFRKCWRGAPPALICFYIYIYVKCTILVPFRYSSKVATSYTVQMNLNNKKINQVRL